MGKLFCWHILIWLIAEVLVNPLGDFPLNDDWAYSQNVYFLSEEGRIYFSDWPAMTLIVQVLWGTLFSSVLGFSFTVLRLSTLVLAVAASWGAFVLFHYLVGNKTLAYGGALLLMFNPLYFCLSNSFMTEIPFLSFFIPGVYCLIRVLNLPIKDASLRYWWWGICFGWLATMVRQPGLLLPLSFGAAYLLKYRASLFIRVWVIALLPFVISFASYKAYSLWLEMWQGLPPTYGKIHQLLDPLRDGSWWFKLVSRNNDLWFYWGWSMLPLTIYLFRYYWCTSKVIQRVLASVVVLLSMMTYCWEFDLFPMGNVFGNIRLGPKTMFSDRVLGYLHAPVLPDTYWAIIKIVGLLGGGVLMFELVIALICKMRSNSWPWMLLLLFSGAYYVFLLLNPFYCDRYSLMLVPLLIAILLPPSGEFDPGKWWQWSSVVIFGFIAWFSITGTHDYLAWNRVRWEMTDSLMVQRGIPVEQINGGFEVNGWYNRKELHLPQKTPVQDTAHYALAFEPFVCGWLPIKAYSFSQWMTFSRGYVHLHQKQNETPYLSIFCDAEKQINAKGDLATSDSTLILTNRAPLDATVAFSGNYSIRLDKATPFSFGIELDKWTPCFKVVATVWRKQLEDNMEKGRKVPSVIVVKTDDLYYQHAKVLKSKNNGWELVKCELQLHNYTESDKVNIYLWNSSGNTQWFDDFQLTVETE